MAQDVKIIANVGYLKGLGGNGVIYAGKTEGGTYLFALKHLEGGEETFRYYRKSRIQAAFEGGEVILATDLNMNLFTDSESPDFVTESADVFKVITTVTNGDDVARLYNFEPAYTIKGENVTTSDIDKLKVATTNGSTGANTGTGGTTGGTTGGSTTTGGLTGFIPSDFSTLLSNPFKFIQDNMMFVLVVLAAIWFIRRKKRKPLWIL